MGRALTVRGWDLELDGEEPFVRDIELGERLGFERPRDIRKLVERMYADGILNDSDLRATVARWETLPGVAKTTREYLLTETAALLVTGRSDTKIAHQITRQIVEVFLAARRRVLEGPTEPVRLEFVHGSRIRDVPSLRAEMERACRLAAVGNNVSIARVHGYLRRCYGITSPYNLSTLVWPTVRPLLDSIALGEVLLLPRPDSSETRQMRLFHS